MLGVEDLHASYGSAPALFGVSLAVDRGEAVALLGRNGMGKTTTVRAILGLLPSTGRIVFAGRAISGRPAYRIAQAGIGLVPEGRQVFPTLSVHENLVATAAARHGRARWTLREVYGLFPRLAERRTHLGSQLSGGEQQMLAIGRALMTNPRLLILDEATEGLAPLVRARDLGRPGAAAARGSVDPRDRQEHRRALVTLRPSRGLREGLHRLVGLDGRPRRRSGGQEPLSPRVSRFRPCPPSSASGAAGRRGSRA